MSTEREAYESYQGFLRTAVRAYWESSGRSKINFLALLLACREAWQVAWAKAAGSGKKILTGAAGAAAIALLLRVVVGGPIGLLLTGASIASLVAIYVKNHERIWERVAHYKTLVDEYRDKYDELQRDFEEGGLKEERRDLMIDGLMARFLVDLDAEREEDEDDEDDEDEGPEKGSLGAHIAKKRAEAEASRDDGASESDDEDDD